MRSTLFFFAAIFCSATILAKGKPEYAVSKISADLARNADAVVRLQQRFVAVRSLNEVEVKEHGVVTIMNKDGDGYSMISESFSKLKNLDEINVIVYDKDGNVVEKIKRSEFRIVSGTTMPGYYDDDKSLVFNTSYKEYPYTIEYFSTVTQLHTFFFSPLVARPSRDLAVERVSMSIAVPASFALRYHSINGSYAPTITSEDGKKIYSWQIENIPAEKEEFLTKEEYDGSPVVLVAPGDFQLGSLRGNMSEWKGFSKFLWDLNKGRDILTPDKAAKIKELTAGVTDPYEKIRRIYKYMQENTRYVSIQYGVGGWQTLDAKFLCQNQYGDCKALSNYMHAMLKEAGITSYPAVVYAGAENSVKLIREFPCNVFNHEILCVPMAKDTVWLECTSAENPAGYLGSFTDDRDVLLMTPEGGAVVRTPSYRNRSNSINRAVKAEYIEGGAIHCDIKSSYAGPMAERMLRVEKLSQQDKVNYVHKKFDLQSYTVQNYSVTRNDRPGLLALDEEIKMKVENMSVTTGGYVMVDMDILPLSLPFQVQVTERRKPFNIPASYIISDSLRVAFPENMEFQDLPENVNVNSAFGQLTINLKREGNVVLLERRLTVLEGEHKPSDYASYETWVDQVASTEPYRLVLRKK